MLDCPHGAMSQEGGPIKAAEKISEVIIAKRHSPKARAALSRSLRPTSVSIGGINLETIPRLQFSDLSIGAARFLNKKFWLSSWRNSDFACEAMKELRPIRTYFLTTQEWREESPSGRGWRMLAVEPIT